MVFFFGVSRQVNFEKIVNLEQSSLFFPKSGGFKLGGDNVIFGMYGLNPGINCVGLGR